MDGNDKSIDQDISEEKIHVMSFPSHHKIFSMDAEQLNKSVVVIVLNLYITFLKTSKRC